MATFAVIRTRCSVRFSDAAFALVTDATWKDYVNATYRRVIAAENLWPFRELETQALVSVAATRTIALPTDATRVISVHDHTNGFKLEPLEGTAEFLYLDSTQTSSGVPVNYRVRASNLLLYPLPEAVYTYYVEYLGRLADLSADGDIPAFPSQYHDILVEGALADAYADDGNDKQYSIHNARYEDLLQSMRQDLMGERHERYYQVVDNFY